MIILKHLKTIRTFPIIFSLFQLLCMLAWAGLTLGAPIDNTELIVNKVVMIIMIMEIMMMVI